MATLNDDVKKFIVQALACHDTPSQVADAVKEEFGIEISRMQVSAYDPYKAMGKNLSKKWKELFDATRKKFVDETASIPIAQQTVRLRALNRMFQTAEKNRNPVLAAQILEQAAREVGGGFTNKQKHEHSGPNGLPMQTHDVTKDEFTEIARNVANEV